jgi:hypothetical protein
VDIQSLESRLQHLEDERSILMTLYQYGHALDYGPEEAFLDVFTPDGEWSRLEGRQPAKSFKGTAELTTMIRSHTRAPEYFHKHVVVNPVISVDGDKASARSYLLFVNEHPEGPYIRAFSRCNDDLVRGADNRWRIKQRKAELEAWSDREFPPPPLRNA